MKNIILCFLILFYKNINGQTKIVTPIQYEDEFEIIEGNFFGKLKFDTLRNDDGSYEIGNVAISKTGDTSNLKVGLWKKFDKGGDLKSFGEYKIGSYIGCCTVGPCRNYYNYKFDKWIYYYTKSKLKAIGKYSINTIHIETSCVDGDNVKVHNLNDEWRYWDLKSNPIKINKALKEELEKIEFLN